MMDTTAVGDELVEYRKEQLFWAFQFPSAAVWARCLKLKLIVELENRFGHGRTGRTGCAGPVFVRLRTKHFSRAVGLLCLREIIPFILHCLWKEILSQQRIRHFKILQSVYFAYDVGIISYYSNSQAKATSHAVMESSSSVTPNFKHLLVYFT